MLRNCPFAIVLACGGISLASPPTFRGLGRPPAAQYEVRAHAASDDGSYIAGTSMDYTQFHGGYFYPVGVAWRAGSGIEAVPEVVRDITPDGAFVVGTTQPLPPSAFFWGWRWDVAAQAQTLPLGAVPGLWEAVAISENGEKVLVGTDGKALILSGVQVETEIVAPIPFPAVIPTSMSHDASTVGLKLVYGSGMLLPGYWSQGVISQVHTPGPGVRDFVVSGDGQAFAGTYFTAAGERAFRATRHSEFAPLGLANFSRNRALCLTDDGDVIGGAGWQSVEQRWRAILWNRAVGTRDLKSVLIQMGLTEVIPWRLTEVVAISRDGSVLVGNGENPAGMSEPWVAHIPAFCYANCDGSTASPFLNISDFSCFLTRFAAGDAYANCDRSTTVPRLNVADFTCFLQQYASGCSK